jgi:hypothetical protein
MKNTAPSKATMYLKIKQIRKLRSFAKVKG